MGAGALWCVCGRRQPGPTSTALKDAGVDCSTTWDGSKFQSPMVQTAKEWRNAGVEEPTVQNLN